jgi:spore germination cell wall hydrolase CwlJ-like protein
MQKTASVLVAALLLTAVEKSAAVRPISPSDRQLLVGAVLGEAAGESIRGMAGVLHVINNRAGGDLTKVASVLLAPRQFSCFNGASTRREAQARARRLMTKHASQLPQAEALTDRLIAGTLADVTNGATYYLNPHAVAYRPEWARASHGRHLATIGRHEFWRPR